MNKMRCLLSALLCLFLVSCAPVGFFVAGTAAGVGGYKYYKGALNVLYQAPYADTWDASVKVFESMNFVIHTKVRDTMSGKIEATRADNKPVTISLKYKSTQETDASIRVGIFGDENASNVIKDRIARELFK
ncbi:MAG: DUF3568 family protein [Deltaproteobacteria bacterium]|nr:DUF3568 family protein [Deltaproteobacteria bacterium]